MKSESLLTTKHILTGSLLGAALLMTPMTALAQSTCRTGSCGRTAGNEDYRVVIAKDLIKSAEPTVKSGSLMDAWLSIKSVDEQIEELDVRTLSEIRNGIGALVNTLQERSDEALASAQENYFEGYHEDAVDDFDTIASLKGLPAAKRAQLELDKEDDRATWRDYREKALEQIASEDHAGARDSLSNLDRLARRTGYQKHLRELTTEIADSLLPRVEEAQERIAQGQYEQAYTTLIEIARITQSRATATAARKVLGKNASLPGMRQAKAEYDARQRLNEAKQIVAGIAHPSTQERKAYQMALDLVATKYKGTQAGEEAKQMLLENPDRQATGG